MVYLKIFFVSLCFCINTGYAQPNDIEFLVKKIKGNYAGYYDKTNDQKFDNYIRKVLKQENKDTFKILSRIVTYFEDQHLQLYAVDAFKYVLVDTTVCKRTLVQLKGEFWNSGGPKDPYEGYWVNDQFTNVIAIKKELQAAGTYEGYLVESRSSRIPFGFAIAKIEKWKNKKYLTDLYAPRSGNRVILKSVFIGDSILITGDIAKWKKIKTPYSGSLLLTNPPILIRTTGSLLDSNNYLLTIPSFGTPNNEIVDSIIKTDYQKIVSAKNLIIDIRNNTGGTVRGYTPLLPFIYTKPIIEIGGYTRCTQDLIQHRKESLAGYLKKSQIDSTVVKTMELDIKKAQANQGRFFFEAGDTLKFDSVMVSPHNVAIITNYACESAAEMMILDFKQSDKVTTFGEQTMGAVDYLNTYPIELPSKKYILILATVKRYISPGQRKLDGIGISPDVSIPPNVTDWVDFVKKYYRQND